MGPPTRGLWTPLGSLPQPFRAPQGTSLCAVCWVLARWDRFAESRLSMTEVRDHFKPHCRNGRHVNVDHGGP
jgi:hypothetical protein